MNTRAAIILSLGLVLSALILGLCSRYTISDNLPFKLDRLSGRIWVVDIDEGTSLLE